jgi:hypothetical protein
MTVTTIELKGQLYASKITIVKRIATDNKLYGFDDQLEVAFDLAITATTCQPTYWHT